MQALLTRELLGKLGQSAWRPGLIGWGISSAIVALAWAFVIRFAMGLTTLQDIGALVIALVPLAQYIHIRGPSSAPISEPPTPYARTPAVEQAGFAA